MTAFDLLTSAMHRIMLNAHNAVVRSICAQHGVAACRYAIDANAWIQRSVAKNPRL